MPLDSKSAAFGSAETTPQGELNRGFASYDKESHFMAETLLEQILDGRNKKFEADKDALHAIRHRKSQKQTS